MTHVSEVLAQADRLATEIQRQPHGWRTYVTVQDMAPNWPTYSWANAGAVDHCGLSVNAVYAAAGLVMGEHFGNNAWTPSGYEWMRARGRLVPLADVQPGDSVYIRWSPSGFNVHHIELADGTINPDGTVPTRGWNVDTTGQGRRFNRPASVIVGIGRPLGIDYAPPKPDPAPQLAAAVTAIIAAQQQEETMPLIVDLTDQSGVVVDHRVYIPGMGGWKTPTAPNLDEARGWQRFACPADQWVAFEHEGLAQVDRMTEAIARRVLGVINEAD